MGDVLGLKGKNVKEKRKIITDYFKTYLQSFDDKFKEKPNVLKIYFYFFNSGKGIESIVVSKISTSFVLSAISLYLAFVSFL